jgi:hypothetical protein
LESRGELTSFNARLPYKLVPPPPVLCGKDGVEDLMGWGSTMSIVIGSFVFVVELSSVGIERRADGRGLGMGGHERVWGV